MNMWLKMSSLLILSVSFLPLPLFVCVCVRATVSVSRFGSPLFVGESLTFSSTSKHLPMNNCYDRMVKTTLDAKFSTCLYPLHLPSSLPFPPSHSGSQQFSNASASFPMRHCAGVLWIFCGSKSNGEHVQRLSLSTKIYGKPIDCFNTQQLYSDSSR